MSAAIEPYSEGYRSSFAACLEANGMLDDGMIGQFWRRLLDEPYRSNDAILLALDDDVVVGAGILPGRAYGRVEGRCSLIWVNPEKRRKGVGSALKRSLDGWLAAHRLSMHYAFLLPKSMDAVPFLEANGFELVSEDLIIGWNGESYHYKPVEGVRCDVYCGGDPVLNEKIAQFQNKAFVRELLVPHLTGEHIAYILEREGHWMMVATEEATGEVVAVTECTDNSNFPSIAVARRYWARGLAEWIGGLCLDRYLEAGITDPWTLVRKANQASIAFLARMNWHPQGVSRAYGARTGL